MRTLFAFLAIVAALRADEPAFDKTLSRTELFALASLAGTPPADGSPLASTGIGPVAGASDDADVARLREYGLADDAGKLTDRGRAVWQAISAPDASLRVRRLSREGVCGTCYSGGADGLWGFTPQKDLSARVFGPFPLAEAAAVLSRRVALPAPSRDAGIAQAFPLEQGIVFVALDSARVAALDPLAGGNGEVGATIDEVSSFALSPANMACIEQDASVDFVEECRRLSPGEALARTLDSLAEAGLVVSQRGAGNRRYILSEKGAALSRAWLHPGESLRVSCITSVGAATAQFCSGPEGLVVVRFRPSSHTFEVASFPQGDPSERYAGIVGELIKEAGEKPALAEKAPAASGRLLGEAIREELSKGVFRSGPVVKTRDAWGRGKPDVTAVATTDPKRADIEYEDTTGDGQVDFVRVRDFPDGPFTRSFVLRDGKWEESNILEAYLEVNYSLPWGREAYHPHDVDVVLNGKVIAQLTDVIPEGLYRFPIRPQDLKVSGDAATANEVRLETKHLRGGHYVVSSAFHLVINLSQVSRAVVAGSAEEAEKIVAERSGLITSGVDPAVYVNEWRADPPAPESGKAVRIRGPVRNQGAETARGVVVRFFDGDPSAGGVKFAEKTLDALEPGDPQEVEGVWKSTPGVHRIFVTLSLPEGTKDLSKDNDQVSISVKTGGDTEPPSLLIAEPAEGARVSAGKVALSGTAKDDVAVASIEYSVDGGLWQRAVLAERWRIEVDLAKGDHVIRVRARDTSGLEAEQARTVKAE